jgi:hypothetical protein
LATFEIDVDRTAARLLPGGLVKLTYPEHGLHELVLRIGPVTYGNPGSPTIKIVATEDIFTQQTQAYAEPPDTGWVDTATEPAPMAFVRPFTLPTFLILNSVEINASELEYPEVIVGFLATQNDLDTFSYDLLGESVDVAGNVSLANLGARQLAGRALLQQPLAAEASTTVSFLGVIGPVLPDVARLVFIGNGSDAAMEIALITAVSEDGWVLSRGVLDTVPRDWVSGTPVWFVEIASTFFDDRVQAAGDSIDYKLLSRTSIGLLAPADAPLVTVSPTARPYRPLRPANVKVASVGFSPFAGAGFGPWTVTWSNRNRLTEDSQILTWTGATVTPEPDQTTTIRVLDATTRAVISEVAGLTGTSYSLNNAAFGGQSQGIVRVTSQRGSLESLQGHEILVTGVS